MVILASILLTLPSSSPEILINSLSHTPPVRYLQPFQIGSKRAGEARCEICQGPLDIYDAPLHQALDRELCHLLLARIQLLSVVVNCYQLLPPPISSSEIKKSPESDPRRRPSSATCCSLALQVFLLQLPPADFSNLSLQLQLLQQHHHLFLLPALFTPEFSRARYSNPKSAPAQTR